MEFWKVTVTSAFVDESYDVTIQMKAPCLYLHMVLFVFQNVRKWNLEIWSKFAFNYVWQWKG